MRQHVYKLIVNVTFAAIVFTPLGFLIGPTLKMVAADSEDQRVRRIAEYMAQLTDDPLAEIMARVSLREAVMFEVMALFSVVLLWCLAAMPLVAPVWRRTLQWYRPSPSSRRQAGWLQEWYTSRHDLRLREERRPWFSMLADCLLRYAATTAAAITMLAIVFAALAPPWWTSAFLFLLSWCAAPYTVPRLYRSRLGEFPTANNRYRHAPPDIVERPYLWRTLRILVRPRFHRDRHRIVQLKRAFMRAPQIIAYLRNADDEERRIIMLQEAGYFTAGSTDPFCPTADVFTRYRHGSSLRRQYILARYRDTLSAAHPKSEYTNSFDIGRLVGDARVMFLPLLIDATDGRDAFTELDFDLSEPETGRYVYRARRRGVDIKHWRDSIPLITAYLGAKCRVLSRDGATLVLERLPDIDPVFRLDPAVLEPGMLYLGRDLGSGKQVAIPFSRMTHAIVAGPTGFGKSSLMHQLMASAIANLDLFDRIYMVDLKLGIESLGYDELTTKITRITKHAELLPLTATLLDLMQQRAELMKPSRARTWTGPMTLVLIDEFADVLLGLDDKLRKQVEVNLIRLANLSRSFGIRIWAQTQHVDTTTVPSGLRRNLTTLVSFKMGSNQSAALFFGEAEGLPTDITTLRAGQFIHRDGLTSETRALQAAYVEFEDVELLALQRLAHQSE